MEHESLYNNIKKAAENAETKDFPNMEKIWNQVETKLDQKILIKENNLWKKIAIGSSVLLVVIVGLLWLKTDTAQPLKQKPVLVNDVTVIDTVSKPKDTIQPETTIETEKDKPLKEVPKTIIISRPALPEVAINPASVVKENNPIESGQLQKPTVTQVSPTYKPIKNSAAGVRRNEDFNTVSPQKTTGKNIQKKENPLLVVDGKTTKYMDLNNMDSDDIENMEILTDPLYIINGNYYTESQLFGPNPTSPYAPLDKQEIETIKILQDEKAVAAYGEKGKKGVVIITTKNGKPAPQKK